MKPCDSKPTCRKTGTYEKGQLTRVRVSGDGDPGPVPFLVWASASPSVQRAPRTSWVWKRLPPTSTVCSHVITAWGQARADQTWLCAGLPEAPVSPGGPASPGTRLRPTQMVPTSDSHHFFHRVSVFLENHGRADGVEVLGVHRVLQGTLFHVLCGDTQRKGDLSVQELGVTRGIRFESTHIFVYLCLQGTILTVNKRALKWWWGII